MEPLLLDKPEACRVLHVGKNKLHTLIAAGLIDIVYIGGISRITAESITRYVGSLPVGMDLKQSKRMSLVRRRLPP